jgi:ATP-dependent helicase/nuclease subunit B
MLRAPLLIPPSSCFWEQAAFGLLKVLKEDAFLGKARVEACDLSGVCVVVPTYAHAMQLNLGLRRHIASAFIPPRATVLSTWLQTLIPLKERPTPESERLMFFYGQLRQYGWLKELFSIQDNGDLLPLADTLLKLSDELTQAMLPFVGTKTIENQWEKALATLPEEAQQILSPEAKLVWTLWQSQLNSQDKGIFCFKEMLRFAKEAYQPLIWINPVNPNELEQEFLECYAKQQPVLPILLDWRVNAITPTLLYAWPELVAHKEEKKQEEKQAALSAVSNVFLCPAKNLEAQAQQGAQMVIDWLQTGKKQIAIVAQDRVIARRIRALLARANVIVCDETGWKLSTTRAAAAIMAWLDLVMTRAETLVLFDFLKSPFFLCGEENKFVWLMNIEQQLRNKNVLAGWNAIEYALTEYTAENELIHQLALQARLYKGKKTVAAWVDLMLSNMEALAMQTAFAKDEAGRQIMALLYSLKEECAHLQDQFLLAEWRAFLHFQFEQTAFIVKSRDHRVMMLPLNGMRLRSFDAVLLVGADHAHLPSRTREVLFFSDSVKKELKLTTREQRSQQQLRDVAEVIMSNPIVVFSWQSFKNNEVNFPSLWIDRLEFVLQQANLPLLEKPTIHFSVKEIKREPILQPAPVASNLLPSHLSASGWQSLLGCPYQFFVTRMLGLKTQKELEKEFLKRDYGGWCHAILKTYHDAVKESKGIDAKALLEEISYRVFDEMLEKNHAVLGYYVRWKKVIPAYIAWQTKRDEEGWQYQTGEVEVSKEIKLSDRTIVLKGRIDRIDQKEKAMTVLDYKTGTVESLRKKVGSGEDHQLSFYGALMPLAVEQGEYISLEVKNNKIDSVAVPNYTEHQEKLILHISQVMEDIIQRTPLPAQGVERVCQYCEVRGICRRGMWHES